MRSRSDAPIDFQQIGLTGVLMNDEFRPKYSRGAEPVGKLFGEIREFLGRVIANDTGRSARLPFQLLHRISAYDRTAPGRRGIVMCAAGNECLQDKTPGTGVRSIRRCALRQPCEFSNERLLIGANRNAVSGS